MTHYRITFEAPAGQPIGVSAFDATDDTQAALRGRALVPARISGYEIWRDDGLSTGKLVFAEWKLTRASARK